MSIGEDDVTVDVCLTTVSGRQEAFSKTLKSLLNQSLKDYRLRVYLSRAPYMLDAGFKTVPAGWQEIARSCDGQLSFHFVDNTGPYRKILPRLIELFGQSRLLVTADDDTVYPPTWLEGLIAAYQHYRCVVGMRGHQMVVDEKQQLAPYRQWMQAPLDDRPSFYAVPTGKDGVVYPCDGLHPAVLDITQALHLAPTADDLWLKWHSLAAGMPSYIINRDYAKSLPSAVSGPTLFDRYNEQGGNDATVDRLTQYAKRALGLDFHSQATFEPDLETLMPRIAQRVLQKAR